ncbi:hypothetical protein [Cryobacterium sp. Hh7]|uniref:hypothetical protein n=1 Tax=Cryobacterium sp. Hh7 TaxID=1259159 RepID=UPI0018E07706|nr:hypothetical protein [Cryobacterium sp. Hh7]
MDGDHFPSLGYHVADQMREYLAAPDNTDFTPFEVTREQLEFLVRFYEVDPHDGHRVKHRAVLSRSRGWGKSPFLAAIGIAEALFEVNWAGWDADGQPVGKPWSVDRTPLVLITAVSEDQARRNTWGPLLEMIREGSVLDEFNVDPMDTFVALPKGKIEMATAAARAIKGSRAVCAIMDQTEEWVRGNGGVRLAQTLRNNATKIGGVTIESPNAFTPGEKSVAEDSARFWENTQSGKYANLKDVRSLLYDHREAPADTDIADHESLIRGLRIAYGDSSGHPGGCMIHNPPCAPGWAPIERIALDFYDTSNDPQTMRQDFLSQITHASNAYISAPEWRAILDTEKVVTKAEPITLGFDGSEGRKVGMGIADSTVLIGYSVTQKHLFQIGVWEQPDGPSGDNWRPPTLEVEAAVREAFKNYNVIGFYADPSAGWAGQVKTWEAENFKKLKVKMTTDEPIKWRQKDIGRTVDAFANMHSAIVNGEMTHDGSKALTAHFLNARRDPRRNGYVLMKPENDQDYSKIDATWGAAFAHACGIDALGKGIQNTKQKTAPRRLY